MIVRDNDVGLAVNSAFEDAVVVRIGRNQIEYRLRDNNLSYLGNQADSLLKVGLGPSEIRPKDLGDLPDNWDGHQ